MDQKQLIASLNKINEEIINLKKQIKRYKLFLMLTIILSTLFLICGILFIIFSLTNKGNMYTILCIVFFVLFLISLQLCFAFFYIIKKILMAKLNSYAGINKILEQENNKEKC